MGDEKYTMLHKRLYQHHSDDEEYLALAALNSKSGPPQSRPTLWDVVYFRKDKDNVRALQACLDRQEYMMAVRKNSGFKPQDAVSLILEDGAGERQETVAMGTLRQVGAADYLIWYRRVVGEEPVKHPRDVVYYALDFYPPEKWFGPLYGDRNASLSR